MTIESISDIESLPENFTNTPSISENPDDIVVIPQHQCVDSEVKSNVDKHDEIPRSPNLKRIQLLCDDPLPKQHADHEPQFEDWYENEVDSDSASEEFEHSVNVEDLENNFLELSSNVQCLAESVEHEANDRLKELLSEAIYDTEENSPKCEFQSSERVRRTLSEDDDIFEGRLPKH